MGHFLAGPPCLERAYRAYRGIFAPDDAARLVAHYAGTSAAAADDDPTDTLPDHPGDAVSYLELTRYMRNQLLRDSDVMSMAHGLELRVPFVDRTLFESLSACSPALRLRAGKQLLLAAVPEVPAAVARAPKRGFQFPFQRWLSGGLGRFVEDAAAASPVPAREWYQRWTLAMFDNWRAQLAAIPSEPVREEAG